MKIKQLPKKEKELFRRFLIGTEKLLKMIITNKDGFMQQVRRLDYEYGLKVDVNFDQKECRNIFINRENIHNKNSVILNSWPLADKKSFLDSIPYFLRKNDLDGGWENSIITFLLQGIICPPVFNLRLEINQDRLDRGKIVMLLNPNTSPKDIKTAWDEIERMQKQSWPSKYRRKNNVTQNKISDIIKYWQIELGKYRLTEKEKFSGLDGFQRLLAKQGKYEEVVKLRRQSGLKSPQLKIRTKKTDAELAKRVDGISSKKKGSQLARQRRKRIKKW